jgi:hypothetical protein
MKPEEIISALEQKFGDRIKGKKADALDLLVIIEPFECGCFVDRVAKTRCSLRTRV